MKKIYLFDPGHGGFIGGQYMTPKEHGKFFVHKDNSIAYEGLINRKIVSLIQNRFNVEGLKCINICPTELDLPLLLRVNIANQIISQYGVENCIGISIHSNAGGGRGFEIFTSPGQSKSDMYASMYLNHFKKSFADVPIRKEITDGDEDKEADFTMLTRTYCPWFLNEFLFFDNFEDWCFLRQDSVQILYAETFVNFAKEIESL